LLKGPDPLRVLQVTNAISHHQLPLAREIAEMVGVENFRFAVTGLLNNERQQLGWNSQENEPWIIRAGERDKDQEDLERWWDDATVVICGERRFRRMQDRIDRGKLTFYMSERWWKPPIGMARLLHPRYALMTARFVKIAKSPLLHYLPMGGTAADDMRRIAAFDGRMWQWGYLTELPDPLPSCDRNSGGLRVLWAGRMLAWKRVDTLIQAFSRLRQERRDTTLTLVGDGPERIRLESLAKKLLAADSYRFHPPMPVPRVLELMRQHHIYVLPSNGYEGWGAVVNEAMSVGCAVVASAAAGAAKTIIRNGENGLLFAPGDWRTLSDQLNLLGSNETVRLHLAQRGQRTIVECWAPAVAAERFLAVSRALLSDHRVPNYHDGPMVPAWKRRP
jgi:glycosyltransferase involved in cell wall biosynthesis